MKEEFDKDMGNPQEKESNRNTRNKKQNTGESHFSRLEQVEDRISGLEDKKDFKEKSEELLDKRLKSCKRNMQELSDSIKRPNP
jgi:chromosome segregation ATPase